MAIRVYIVSDMSTMDEVDKFKKFVKEKGEQEIIFVGSVSDDVNQRQTRLTDSMNTTDVCIFIPNYTGDNDMLYFKVGVAFANSIPIIGVGPGFCNKSFLIESDDFKKNIITVQNSFESEEDFEKVLSQIYYAAKN